MFQVYSLLLLVSISPLLISGKSLEGFQKITFHSDGVPRALWHSNYVATWNKAQDDCIARGQQLVSIKDAGSQSALLAAIKSDNLYVDPWISLHREDTGAPWVWGDGTPMVYSNWGAGEPDPTETKVRILGTAWPGMEGEWWTCDDSCERTFLCE